MYSAEGDLTEMETERIKQEMEDHFEDPLEEGEGELTAEEMRMMMGEDKDDTKKILHVSTVLSAALWSLHCPALPCTALHCPALPCTALHCPALPCTALPCAARHRTAFDPRTHSSMK